MEKLFNLIGYALIILIVTLNYLLGNEFQQYHLAAIMLGIAFSAIPSPYEINAVKLIGWLVILFSVSWYANTESTNQFLPVVTFIIGTLLSGLQSRRGNDSGFDTD